MFDEVLVMSLTDWLQDTVGPHYVRRTIDTQAMLDLPRSMVCIYGTYVYSLLDVYRALDQYMPDLVHTVACTQLVQVVGLQQLFHQLGSQWCQGGISTVHITRHQIIASIVQLPFQIDSHGEIQVHQNRGVRIWTNIDTLHHIVSIYTTPMDDSLYTETLHR